MMTAQQKDRLKELQTKAGLSEPEWEELRKLDRLEARAAKEPVEATGEDQEASDEGDQGEGEAAEEGADAPTE